MDIVKTGKILISILVVVVGAVYFIEDRYQNVVDAKTTHAYIEKASVDSFQQQRQLSDEQIKKLQMEMYIMRLESLREYLWDIERRIEKNPTSIYLKNQIERLKEKIKRLEDRLYQ